jgi:hypothetical protein
MYRKFDPHRPYHMPVKGGVFHPVCPQNEVCRQLGRTDWTGATGKDRSCASFRPILMQGLAIFARFRCLQTHGLTR